MAGEQDKQLTGEIPSFRIRVEDTEVIGDSAEALQARLNKGKALASEEVTLPIHTGRQSFVDECNQPTVEILRTSTHDTPNLVDPLAQAERVETEPPKESCSGSREYSLSWSAGFTKSTLEKLHIAKIKCMCDLDEENSPIISPEPSHVANSPAPQDTFLLSFDHIRVGVTLPLHPFLKAVFRRFNVAPFQLAPNALRAALGMYSLYHSQKLGKLSSKVFAWYYSVVASPNDPNFYTFRIRKDAAPIVGLKTNCGPWKYKWFRVKGAGIPSVVAKPYAISRPLLDDGEIKGTEKIKALTNAERHIKVVCSIANLKACGLIPEKGDYSCVYDESKYIRVVNLL